jgi:hypothetical protein
LLFIASHMGTVGSRAALRTATGAAGFTLLLAPAAAAQQQQLGHKVMGTVGLQAGSQASAGIYAIDQFLSYDSHDLIDRNGNSLPVGLNANAVSNMFGVSATFHMVPIATYVTTAIGVPLSWASVSTDRLEASLDHFGLADLYLQPLQLGWRTGRADVVLGYALYLPTGHFEPGAKDGLGNGYWTQEPTLGGTLFLDDRRGWNVSALASLDVNGRMRRIDITRGTTLQVQGGLGIPLLPIMDVGVVASGLWQVSDDSGSSLPALLRGARDRVYTAGAEVGATIAPIRARCTLRYEHDFLALSRPQGQVFFFSLTGLVWDLEPRGAPSGP